MEKMRQRPDGRYIQMVSMGKDKAGKLRRVAVYGATPKELREKVRMLRGEPSCNADFFDGKAAFGDVSRDWLEDKVKTLSKSSIDGYSSALNKHLLPAFGSVSLKKLTANRLKKLFAEMKRDGYSESVMKTVKLCAVQTVEYAKEYGWKGENIFTAVETPKAPAPPLRTLTQDELKTILAKPTGHPMCAAALMMLFAGLKRCEVLALSWENVSRSYIHIENIVVFKTRSPCLQGAGKAKRRVPLPDLLYDLLQDEWQKEGYVCSGKDGGLVSEGAFVAMWESYERFLFKGPYRALQPRQKSGGKLRCIAPSMLRQTYAYMLFRSGADIASAQKMLGHTTLEMTAKLYTQLIPPDMTAAVEALDRRMREAVKESKPI